MYKYFMYIESKFKIMQLPRYAERQTNILQLVSKNGDGFMCFFFITKVFLVGDSIFI